MLSGIRTDIPVSIDPSVPIWTIEHVAAALHLEVDTAREYTYRERFPRPRDGFSKNLWAREEVLAWFAGLPPKPRGRAGEGTPGTATVVRATPRPAGAPSADKRPVGVVDIYAPSSGPYFRLKWAEPDGTRETPAGAGRWREPG